MLLAQKNDRLHLHLKQPSIKLNVRWDLLKSNFKIKNHEIEVFTDTQTSMLSGIPESAICVQRFDDSLNSAIHITYRISLRSSSMREPRDPLLKVVFLNYVYSEIDIQTNCFKGVKLIKPS
jgi:hypothetical protein